MVREKNLSSFSILSDDYISVTLDIESVSEDIISVTLIWPHFNRRTQEKIRYSDIAKHTDHFQLLASIANFPSLRSDSLNDDERKILVTSNELFDSVITGKVRKLLLEYFEFAVNRDLVIVVRTNEALFDVIPWELLGHPEIRINDNQVSINIIRGGETRLVKRKSSSSKIMLASSQSLEIPAIHTATEFYEIEKSLVESGQDSKIVSIDKSKDYRKFITNLKRQNPRILHLALHGNAKHLKFRRGENTQEIPLKVFVGDIRSVKSLELLVMNVCHSAQALDIGNEFEYDFIPSLAKQFFKIGMPAVIGMTTLVTEKAAIEFSRWFYSELGLKETVSVAFQRAISGLQSYNSLDKLFWSVPVLYINKDFIPLRETIQSIYEDLTEPSVWQAEFMKALSGVAEEFIRSYKSLGPKPRWDAYDWKLATNKFFIIKLKLREYIEILDTKLPDQSHAETRYIVLNISRKQKEVEELLNQFEDDLNIFSANDFQNSYRSEFLYSIRELSESLEGLVALFPKFN